MRESSSGYKDDEDTPVCSAQPGKQRQRKKYTSANIRAGNSTKKGKMHDIHLQQEQTFY
jgi:hypothetical protein